MQNRTRFILHVEYAQNAGHHPVYIQLSDGKTMFAECVGKTLKVALQKATRAILKHEEEADGSTSSTAESH